VIKDHQSFNEIKKHSFILAKNIPPARQGGGGQSPLNIAENNSI